MRFILSLKLLTLSLIFSTGLFAQSDADKIDIRVGGSFAKPKIMPSLSKLAIAQLSVNYKLTTTESVIGKEKSSGSIGGAKLTVFWKLQMGNLPKAISRKLPTMATVILSNNCRQMAFKQWIGTPSAIMNFTKPCRKA
jgi:hypothetical protein